MNLGHELVVRGDQRIIVMHDFYGCRNTWAFARQFFDVDRFTYAFVEIGGDGESRNFAGEFAARESAVDVLRLADNLGWQHFHIVGHSMSGMLAQRVVRDGQGRVRSVILNTPVAASGLSYSPAGFKRIAGSIDSDALLGLAFAALIGNPLGPGWERFKIRQPRAPVTAKLIEPI